METMDLDTEHSIPGYVEARTHWIQTWTSRPQTGSYIRNMAHKTLGHNIFPQTFHIISNCLLSKIAFS